MPFRSHILSDVKFFPFRAWGHKIPLRYALQNHITAKKRGGIATLFSRYMCRMSDDYTALRLSRYASSSRMVAAQSDICRSTRRRSILPTEIS